MTKLQTVHWLLLIVPLILRWALRIWQKNLRPLINKKPTRVPPYHPLKSSLIKPSEAPTLLEICSKSVRHCRRNAATLGPLAHFFKNESE